MENSLRRQHPRRYFGCCCLPGDLLEELLVRTRELWPRQLPGPSVRGHGARPTFALRPEGSGLPLAACMLRRSTRRASPLSVWAGATMWARGSSRSAAASSSSRRDGSIGVVGVSRCERGGGRERDEDRVERLGRRARFAAREIGDERRPRHRLHVSSSGRAVQRVRQDNGPSLGDLKLVAMNRVTSLFTGSRRLCINKKKEDGVEREGGLDRGSDRRRKRKQRNTRFPSGYFSRTAPCPLALRRWASWTLRRGNRARRARPYGGPAWLHLAGGVTCAGGSLNVAGEIRGPPSDVTPRAVLCQ